MYKLLILLILLSLPIWAQSSFNFEEWFKSIPYTELSELSLKQVIDKGVITNGMGESMMTYDEDVFGGNVIFRTDEVQFVDVLNIYDNGILRSSLENVYLVEVSEEMNIVMAIVIDPFILVKDIINFFLENKEGALLKVEIVLIKGQYTTFTSDATKDLVDSLPTLE